ncbi:MAG: hypothetical protein GAK43_01042 [Stenotrophomonas maltophilia]|nr:MAG: hypothetical protein GAK43_01042 [Stenotrophomonas maltophilia]
MRKDFTALCSTCLLLVLSGCTTAPPSQTPVASSAEPQGPFLVPLYLPSPDYPPLLSHAGISGSVTVLMDIQPDGKVSHVEVTRANNDLLARSVKQQVAQWRFVPWRSTGESAETVQVIKRFDFQPAGPAPQVVVAHRRIEPFEWFLQPCALVTREYGRFQAEAQPQPLNEMWLFRASRKALLDTTVGSAEHGARTAQIGARFDSVLPALVDRCQQQADVRYGDVLSELMNAPAVDSPPLQVDKGRSP